MYWVVRPVAESVLPEAALSWQSRGPIVTDAAHTTNATRSTHTAGAAHATDTAWPTHTTYAAHTTNAANTTNSTGPTHTTNATDTTRPTHTSQAAGDVVAIEAVEVVDIDIATAPAATPAPTAAPPRSHQHSRAERDCGACRGVAWRIVEGRIWIFRRTVYCRRLICRHVDNFRIGRLNHNHVLVFNYSRFHCLLLSGVQCALVLRLPTHALNGIHHLALLRQEGVAELRSPLNVVSQ
jgi:hypothetical protein